MQKDVIHIFLAHQKYIKSLSNLSFRLKVRLNIEVTSTEFDSTKCFENFDYLNFTMIRLIENENHNRKNK